jgi:hypothetical protein
MRERCPDASADNHLGGRSLDRLPGDRTDLVTDNAHTISHRARTGIGLTFVVLTMVVASVLAGLGFASNSPSAAQYQYGKKIAICHYTGSKKHPWVTLRIDIHAWPAHLQHGDKLGVCPSVLPPPPKHHGKPKGHHHHVVPSPKHGHGHGSKVGDGSNGGDGTGGNGGHHK